jgi:hypothetical protein
MIFSYEQEKFKTTFKLKPHLRLIYCELIIMFVLHFEDNIQIA